MVDFNLYRKNTHQLEEKRPFLEKRSRTGRFPASIFTYPNLSLLALTVAGCGSGGGGSTPLPDQEDEDGKAEGIAGSSFEISNFSLRSENGTEEEFRFHVVAVQDFNNDSFSDFFIAGGLFPPNPIDYFQPVVVISRNGEYVVEPFNGETAFTHPREILFGDFNNDDRMDIFVAAHGYDTSPFSGERNGLFFQDEQGRFMDRTFLLPEISDFSHSASVADVNGDGFVDIFVGNLGVPYLLINDGGNGFTKLDVNPSIFESNIITLEKNSYTALEFGDVDKDGVYELVLGMDHGSKSLIVTFDVNKNDFVIDQVLASGVFGSNSITTDVKIADVNSDGLLDIILAQTQAQPFYTGRGIQILLQEDAGSFTDISDRSQISVDRFWIFNFDFFDIDSDGDLDIVAVDDGSSGHGGYYIFENNGSGEFSEMNSGYKINDFGTDFVSYDRSSGEIFGLNFENDILHVQHLA